MHVPALCRVTDYDCCRRFYCHCSRGPAPTNRSESQYHSRCALFPSFREKLVLPMRSSSRCWPSPRTFQSLFCWLVARRFRMGEVTHLWRFAVKGLDRDQLHHVKLSPGIGFPNDRRWALQLVHPPPQSEDSEFPAPAAFDPLAPSWIHKQSASPS
jgi:hypothetical protein